ncbi:small-conductance mechanosensitive channel [Virgibacillus natechei]|uniref:Small-conductance mechanosensitive channel n=1 Tax=Virgibacillus natechei TaxID=1216297 RepID=A0ABS4IBX9_9BACI|nr:hypothetical protein [Virgibacillus natechei]MBP1968444.1 small-conductance mechanosensitive channel [Virgibacillus natechei]UZD13565.1 hypothetical protein OLD84_03135 [Virgibacillus natechei]
MNRYLKLVNFELARFMKIYLVLIAITIVSQITGVIVKSRSYLSDANEAIYEDLMPMEQFLEQTGPLSMVQINQSIWSVGPIALCIIALLFYCFFIWYRDWLGKNTFIYRLLMLPTARLNVFLAKATAIFLMVLGLVSLQLILLPVESTILKWTVPLDFRIDMAVGEIINNSVYGVFQLLIPQSFIQFVINYGIGFMAVFILFTAILFERSFRWKGVLLGSVYSLVAIAVFLLPILLQGFFQLNYLYPVELLIIEVFLGILVTTISICMSRYLLNKKITV